MTAGFLTLKGNPIDSGFPITIKHQAITTIHRERLRDYLFNRFLRTLALILKQPICILSKYTQSVLYPYFGYA